MAVFRRLAQRISGGVRTPEMDDDTMTQLFAMLHQDSYGQNSNFSQDDWALAYTFASSFPQTAE